MCIERLTISLVLTLNPSSIKLLPDGEHVAVSGQSVYVYILKLSTLRIVRTINCDDWTTSLNWIYKEKETHLLTLSYQKYLSLWSLSEGMLENESSNAFDLPSQSFIIDIEGNLNNFYLSTSDVHLIVLSDTCCIVYALPSFKLLATINAPKEGFASAQWCDDFTFIIWLKRGKGLVYKMSHLSHKKKESKERVDLRKSKKSSTDSGGDEHRLSKRRESHRRNSSKNLFSSHKSKEGHSFIATISFGDYDYTLFDNYVAGVVDDLIYLCSRKGDILVWKLTLASDKILPYSHSHISNGWSSKNAIEDELNVSASMICESTLKMIRGHNDGTITIMKLPTDVAPLTWRAHDKKVTCFLLLMGKNKELLVSGSDDMCINVWDISNNTPTLVISFVNHSGPIVSLFAPSLSKGFIQWKNRFFSISKDNTISLFQIDATPQFVNSFGPHPSRISNVKWRPDQDYLLVMCEDGVLSIWEMHSGHLDSMCHSLDTKTILTTALPLSHESKDMRWRLLSKQSITGITTTLSGQNPLQSLILNVKRLAKEVTSNIDDEKSENFIAKASTNPIYKVCTYLMPWCLDPDLDNMIIKYLCLKTPSPPVSYGLLGYGRSMSVLVPRLSKGTGRWDYSKLLSTSQHLASKIISKSLSEFCPSNVEHLKAAKKVEKFCSSRLPDFIPFLNSSE